MEYLQTLLDNSHVPIFTAFLLGLLTAVSPCPLATNITAIGYVGKRLQSGRSAFMCGLLYTLGRVLAYTLLGSVLIFILRTGGDMFEIQQQVSQWGELLLPPLLVVIGLVMLLGHRLPLPRFGTASTHLTSSRRGYVGGFLLGMIFAMAFCPTSGLFYFGMLIPMSATESGGYFLPVVYAIATALPVLVVAWVMAFSMSSIGKVYGMLQVFQKWLNRLVGVTFVAVGIFYLLQYWGVI